MYTNQGRTKNDADYGLGNVSIDCASLGLIDESDLTQRLVSAFEDPRYQPPRLPAVATELLALSNQRDVDFKQLEALLERDLTLAGEILKLCQSAAYDRGGKIQSLHDALVRIGLAKLSEVVMQAAMSARVFRCNAYKGCMERVQEHCRVVGHLTRLVSQQSKMPDDHAFLCGLLHDVGIAGILIVLGDTKRGEQQPDLGILWPSIHSAHSAAGARMIELWELPQDIGMAVSAHHHVSIGNEDNVLAAKVCLADALASDLGMGFVPPAPEEESETALVAKTLSEGQPIDVSTPSVVDRAKRTLGFDDASYDKVRQAAESWAEQQSG